MNLARKKLQLLRTYSSIHKRKKSCLLKEYARMRAILATAASRISHKIMAKCYNNMAKILDATVSPFSSVSYFLIKNF